MSRALAVAFVVLAAPCALRAADYCPMSLMGQWNGMYYYVCTYRSPTGQCGTVYAGSPRLHTVSPSCPVSCNDVIKSLGGGDEKKKKRVQLPNLEKQILGRVKRGDPKVPGSTEDEDAAMHSAFRALDFKLVKNPKGDPDEHLKMEEYQKRKIRADHYIRIRRKGNPAMQEGWHVIRLLRIRVSDSEGDIGIGQESDIPFDDAAVVEIPGSKPHVEEGDNPDDRFALTVNVHNPDPDGPVASLDSVAGADQVPFSYYIIMHEKWKKP